MSRRTRVGWFGTGLAVAVLLAACTSITEPVPLCANAAPLQGQLDPNAPGYIVQLRPGVPVHAEVDRLAAKWGFTPTHVYEFALTGFAAELSPGALAGVRCESSVVLVEHDAVMTIAMQARQSGTRLPPA